MLKTIQFTNWAFMPHTHKMPFHEGINLMNGHNGSGKTSYLDAVRWVFGTQDFGNKRNLYANYIHQGETWAMVIIELDNNPDPTNKLRPLHKLGMQKEVVSLVRKVSKKSGHAETVNYIIDGSINPQDIEHYTSITFNTYRRNLESIGITRAFLNVISTEQGKVDALAEIVDSEKLMAKILHICGDADILNGYEKTREELKIAKDNYDKLHLEQYRTKEQYNEMLEKWRKYQEYKGKLEKLNVAGTSLKKSDYMAITRRLIGLQSRLTDLRTQETVLSKTLEDEKGYLKQIIEDLVRLALKIQQHENVVDTKQSDKDSVSKDYHEFEKEVSRREEKIKELSALPDIDKEITETSLIDAEKVKEPINEQFYSAKSRHMETKERLTELQNKKIIYPKDVQEFQIRLRNENIEHMLFCDFIEITDERWRPAVESLLGATRFDIVVPAERDVVRVKKLAQVYKYRHYISRPNIKTLSCEKGTAASVITLTDNRIGGWLDFLENTRLVENVEEGDKLSLTGIKSITKECYMQDRRGGKYIGVENFCCGKNSYEARLKVLTEEFRKIETEYRNLLELKNKNELEIERCKTALNQYEQKLILPGLEEELKDYIVLRDELYGKLQKISEELVEHKAALIACREKSSEKNSQSGEYKNKIDSSEVKLKAVLDEIETNQQHQVSGISQKENVINELKKSGLTVEEISVISSEDVQSADYYKTEMVEIDKWIHDCPDEYKQMTDNHFRQIQSRDLQLKSIEKQIQQGIENIELCTKKNNDMQVQYNLSVQIVCREFERAIKAFGADNNIQIQTKAEQKNEMTWSMIVKFGFDGKSPDLWCAPGLSGGQKAIASLSIMIAAIKVSNRSSKAFRFLLLDEPMAHLDFERIQEVGNFLKNTKGQYLLTVPNPKDEIRHYSWADQLITLRKLKSGENFAPVPIITQKNPNFTAKAGG